MKIIITGLLLLGSISSSASIYSACFCKDEISTINKKTRYTNIDRDITKTSVYGIYTNNVTGEIQEKKISEVGINSTIFGADNEKCDNALEELRKNNVCPEL